MLLLLLHVIAPAEEQIWDFLLQVHDMLQPDIWLSSDLIGY